MPGGTRKSQVGFITFSDMYHGHLEELTCISILLKSITVYFLSWKNTHLKMSVSDIFGYI